MSLGIKARVFFFPVPAPNGASPSPAFRRGRSKKRCFFFAVAPPKGRGAHGAQTKKKHSAHPGTTAKNILESNDTGHEQKGTTKIKKRLTHCGPGPRCSLTCFPGRLSGRARLVFFFCCGPAWTPTHSLPAWAAMPPAGVVPFFFCCGPARTGVVCVCFFCCGPARTLTHSLWAGAISARPGWCCFFLRCGPVEPGEPIRTNVWCTTSGLKRPGGATAKKKTPLPGLLLSSTL